MKKFLVLPMVLGAAAIGSAACSSADAGESTAATSAPASWSTASTTEPPVVTFRKPANSTVFSQLFDGARWNGVALLTYTTFVCDSLDGGGKPENVIDGVLRDLQSGPARPFPSWDLFDAQMLYAATTQHVCPEYLGKYVPN
ncbi:hypothetical protein GS536_21210 [Rhodococcus hoagii]|nr:hypothetical protein [Prescottella equi]